MFCRIFQGWQVVLKDKLVGENYRNPKYHYSANKGNLWVSEFRIRHSWKLESKLLTLMRNIRCWTIT